MRDYTQREIETREAFANALKSDVLSPLIALRDTQTRIQNRIREDLKDATGSYEEYAFTKVPKMQRSYNNKTQAVEDYKKQQHAIEMQAKLLAEQMPKEPPEVKPHPYSAHGHSPSTSSINNATGSWASGLSEMGSGTPPSTATAPAPGMHVQQIQQAQQPTSPGPDARAFEHRIAESRLDNRNLGHGLSGGLSGRARSGSGSYAATMQAVDAKSKEVFSDIAAHSKKGFAAIMQRLGGEREGEIPPSVAAPELPGASSVKRGSVRHNNGVVKGAKTKRDAEEADKAYRTGVFHLETLRLRREKLQQSAITSLGQFNDELNATLFVTLRAFANVSHGTAATLAQSTDVVFNSFRGVNLGRDTQLFKSRLPVVSRYAPVLYENFYVGPCRSLIFGFRLTDYDFTRGESANSGLPPMIVEKCIAWVDAMGPDAEGIYRMSGRQATVKRLIQRIEQNEEAFYFTPDDDVYSVGVVFKTYLRDLPDPLFPLPHAERIKWTESRESHFANQFATLRGRLRRLPQIHQTTFQAVIEHLNRISRNAAENKMDAKNLAVVFNSVLFGQDQVPADADALKMHLQKDTVLEDIITHPEFVSSFRSLPADTQLFHSTHEPQSPSKTSSTKTGSSRTRLDAFPQSPQHAASSHMPRPSLTGIPQAPAVHTPPLHVYATQHPIAAQHARGGSDGVGQSQQYQQAPAPQPISFEPPSHTSTGQHVSAQSQLPAGALQPYQPPHPSDGLGLVHAMGGLDLQQQHALATEQALNGRSGLTPDAGLLLLFDPSKIPSSMRDSIPPDYHVRPLASDDFLRAHFGLLSTLSPSPALAPSVYTALFNALRACADTYFIVVIVDRATDQVVASGTVIRERKFIHGGGYAGHIEDIVVGPSAQGRGLGVKLVVGLRDLATDLGCYKTILDCQESKVREYLPSPSPGGSDAAAFYEKCGFTLRGRQMAYYVPTADAPPRRESLAKTGLPTAPASTSVRPPMPVAESDEDDMYSDTASDRVSLAETAETTETADTEDTFTGVSYSFPTSGGNTNLAGVASPASTASPAASTPTDGTHGSRMGGPSGSYV